MVKVLKAPENMRVVEKYYVAVPTPVGDAKIEVSIAEGINSLYYLVNEPPLRPGEDKAIEEAILELYSPRVKDIEDEAVNVMERVMRRMRIPHDRLQILMYYLTREFKQRILTPLVADRDNLEDIVCNRPNAPVMITHITKGKMLTNIELGEEELNELIIDMVGRGGKSITSAQPVVDVHLEEGRFAGILGGEVSENSSFTFKLRPSKPHFTMAKLIELGTISAEDGAFLWLACELRLPILIAGVMNAGKTTLANAILNLLPPNARVITVEETRELDLWLPNKMPLYSRPAGLLQPEKEISIGELIKQGLRHAGDYLIVGEIRGIPETEEFFRGIATGMGGVTTIHANDVLGRLRSLKVPKELLSLVKVSVYMLKQGLRRVVHRITEMRLEGEEVVEVPISSYSDCYALRETAKLRGVDLEREINLRREFLSANRGTSWLDFKASLDDFYKRHGATTF